MASFYLRDTHAMLYSLSCPPTHPYLTPKRITHNSHFCKLIPVTLI